MQVFNNITGQWEDDGKAPVPPSQTANPFGGAPAVPNAVAPPGAPAPGITTPPMPVPESPPPAPADASMPPMPTAGGGMLSKELKSTSTTTSYEKPTAKEGELARQRDSNVTAAKSIEDKATEIAVKRAHEEAAGAAAAAKLAEVQQAQATAKQAAWDAEYQRRAQVAKQDEEALRGAKVQDFWADKSTGQKIAAGMAVLFGGLARTKLYAAGNTNATNEGADFITKAIDDDYKKQQARIEQLRQNAARSGKDRDTYLDQIDKMEDRLNIRHAVATKKIATDTTARMAQLLPNQAAVDGNKAKLAIDAKAIEAQQRVEEGIRKKTSTTVNRQETLIDPALAAAMGGGAGKATEGQATAEAQVRSQADALRQIESGPPLSQDTLKKIQGNEGTAKLFEKGGSLAELFGKGTGIVKPPLADIPPAQQKVFLAWQNAAEYKIRALTGAGMSEAEARKSAMVDIPQIGDSAETIRTKLNNLKSFNANQLARVAPGRRAALEQEIQRGGQTPTAQAPQNAQIRDGIEWLRANPTHPKARDVAAKLRAMGAPL